MTWAKPILCSVAMELSSAAETKGCYNRTKFVGILAVGKGEDVVFAESAAMDGETISEAS